MILAAVNYSRNDTPADAQTNAASESQEEDTSLFSSQIKAIDKAKGVEGTIMSSFEKRDAQMDAQGQ